MNVRDVKLRLRALLTPRRVERELAEELAFHLERETRKLIDQGMDPAEARVRAQARFGSVPLAADQCRDARGTAFVDNTIRDIFYAFRTFQRAPLVALTIVSTVSLGLGLVAVAFTLLNVALFRVDPSVPRLHEMFSVEKPRAADGGLVRFTRADYDALREQTSVFTGVYAERSEIDTRIEGRMMSGSLVSGDFFQVLGVDPALGRALTPADDERVAGRPVIVLSDRGWNRNFARDPYVLGRSVLINGFPYEIVGVMPEQFRGLSVSAPHYWAPLAMLGQFRQIHGGRELDTVGVDIIGRLKPGLSRETALAGLAVWNSGRAPAATDRAQSQVLLRPKRGTAPQPLEVWAVTAPLFFAFGLILMIGCANVANLLLARAMARQKELGIRLSLGASRGRIVRQLLTESLLLSLAAAAGGYLVSRLVLGTIVYAVTSTMAADLGDISLSVPAGDWRVAAFLALAAVAATGAFALGPALQAARVEPVRIIRGQLIRDARPGRARSILIGLQVSASALLLIAAGVFLRSTFASATVDSGMRTSDTVVVQIVNEPLRAAMVQAVTTDPLVEQVSAAWPGLMAPPRAALAETNGRKSTTTYKSVSTEYFGLLDLPIVRGRGFTSAELSTDAGVVVVTERTARELWPNAEAVGQALHLGPDPNAPPRRADDPVLNPRSFSVIGVLRDIPGFRFAEAEQPGVYLPTSAAAARTSLVVRAHGDPDVLRQHLLDRLTRIDPNMGDIVTMRTMARLETYFLQVAFWTTLALGGLALALTLSGLFSVLSYLVEQRTREIGIRMALGATTRSVARLVLSQSIRPVGAGLAIGGSMAGGLAALLMASPAGAVFGEIVHVFDPVAYIVSLLCIVAACTLAASIPARRAAHVDPATTLRQD
jgi:predicted permease